ncbi:MAG: LOG family protein [Ignavibacteria bacterium]
MNNKIITSFGSAFIKPNELLYSQAEEIGKYIAEAGHTICSGGYYGTMEAISKGAKSAGGKTIGISVKGWENKVNHFIDEDVMAENLMERILKLINIADAYIIFKGGTGTLLEISAALELMNKKAMPEKRMIFYSGFWRNVIDVLREDSENTNALIERNIVFINRPDEFKL